MNTPAETLKFPGGNPLEALRSLQALLKGASSSAAATGDVRPDQIGPELAYKLAQASARAVDRELLATSIVGLLDALAGIEKALSRPEGM